MYHLAIFIKGWFEEIIVVYRVKWQFSPDNTNHKLLRASAVFCYSFSLSLTHKFNWWITSIIIIVIIYLSVWSWMTHCCFIVFRVSVNNNSVHDTKTHSLKRIAHSLHTVPLKWRQPCDISYRINVKWLSIVVQIAQTRTHIFCFGFRIL